MKSFIACSIFAARLPRLARRGAIHLVLALVFAIFFAACGGDSSTSVSPEPSDDSSSSVIPASSGDLQSSSSQKSSGKDKSSSSIEEKSSSSEGDKNSNSSEVESSSSSANRRCEEGALDTLVDENSTAYMRCINNRWRTDSIVYTEKPKVYPNMDSLFATEYSPIYSEFEDPRDHQVYRTTILIDRNGSDKTIEVFAQNLNYGEMIDTSVLVRDDNKVEKYCDLNDEWFCNNGWGGQYAWSEAMGLPAKYDSVLWKDTVGGDTRIHQGICPEGWHIMNGYEWKNFASTAGQDLVSKANWKLNKRYVNSSGMSVLFTMRAYELNWELADFFFPTEREFDAVFEINIGEKYVNYGEQHVLGKQNHAYIRCVKDY